MRTKIPFQEENFYLKTGAQIAIFSILTIIFLVRGSISILRPVDVIALVLFNALIWCRRPLAADRPWLGVHVYLGLQGLLACWLYTRDVNFGHLFLLIYVQALLLAPLRSRLVWIILFFSALVGGNFFLHPEPDVEMTPALRLWVFGTIIIFITFMVIHYNRARTREKEIDNLLVELSHSYRRLQDYAEKVETLTIEEERNRISRELHDAIGHRLTTSLVQLEGALQLIRQHETQRATTMLGNVHEQLYGGLDELRDTLHALRTPKVTDGNLTHMLQRLADAFTIPAHARIHTRLPDELPSKLSSNQCLTIYRAAQEALTNAAKHARARNVWIALDCRSDQLILTVRNDGRDFSRPSESGGYGLQGMRERAAQLDGTLMVNKSEDGGTLLTLSLPLQPTRRLDMSEERLALDLEEIVAKQEKGDGANYV